MGRSGFRDPSLASTALLGMKEKDQPKNTNKVGDGGLD